MNCQRREKDELSYAWFLEDWQNIARGKRFLAKISQDFGKDLDIGKMLQKTDRKEKPRII